MTGPVLELAGVWKTYPGAVPVTAVADASFSASPGELIALTGPSGSGKSTLLGLLGLLDVPTSGSVRIAGSEAGGLSDGERSRLRASLLGFVFQQFNLIPHLSALDNVITALLYRGLAAGQRRERASTALERVGLAHRLHHRPAELSGGEQQRVALARAIVASPAVILADEPTGNLDAGSSRVVLDLLGTFVADGVAAVVATHNPEVAARASRLIAMRDGRLLERS